MNRKALSGILTLAMIGLSVFTLFGCSSSDSDDVLQGRFVDGAVAGISYRSVNRFGGVTYSGATDADGTFLYREGDFVEFFIGGIVIGKAVGEKYITPIDLIEGAVDETHPYVINIIRFLQTIDDDGDAENGILITSSVANACAGFSIDFRVTTIAFETSLNVGNIVTTVTALTASGTRGLIDLVYAQRHFRRTLIAIQILPGGGTEEENIVALSNCYRISFLGVVYHPDETSEWKYRVEELTCAKDLSHWVLALPSCVAVAGASPAGYEIVSPDPATGLTGIEWDTDDDFQSGEFTIILNGHWKAVNVAVACKGGALIGVSQISGPSCTPVVADEDSDHDGYTVLEGDCNDADSTVHPGAQEICGDSIDQNCDGADTGCSAGDVVILINHYRITFLGVFYHTDGTSTWKYLMEELPSAQDLSNWVLELPGCVTVVSASPTAYELVNPDPNANIAGVKWQTGAGFQSGEFTVTLDLHWKAGSVAVAAKGPDVERSLITGPSCQIVENTDQDGDGYPPSGGDCNDADSAVHPGAQDICGDGVDQNCDGADASCDPSEVDADNDGYTVSEGDCNDADSAVHPGAQDICGDGIDQDCDGVDRTCPTPNRCENLVIPNGALPPPGECKAWDPDLPAGQQGPPIPCNCALVAPGDCLIDHNGNVVNCN